MIWTEELIARAIALQTLARKCVVLVDNCQWTGHECDVLGVTTDLRVIDVEVKVSRADLKSDAAKDKWWHRLSYCEAEELGLLEPGKPWDAWAHKTARPHPPKVWKHYYAMPKDIWRPELLDYLPSSASGILLLSKQGGTARDPDGGMVVVNCLRRATPAKDAYRLKPAQVMDIARLANLRMWEAYRRRDEAEREAWNATQQIRAVTGDCWRFGEGLREAA